MTWFSDILAKHQRVAVTGGPKTGKTTLTQHLPCRVVHTDDAMHLGWSEASAWVAEHVNSLQGPLVVEGVAVPRALRKGMRVDAVVYLEGPHEELTKGQKAMAAGVWTVLKEWRDANPDVPAYFASTAPPPTALAASRELRPEDYD